MELLSVFFFFKYYFQEINLFITIFFHPRHEYSTGYCLLCSMWMPLNVLIPICEVLFTAFMLSSCISTFQIFHMNYHLGNHFPVPVPFVEFDTSSKCHQQYKTKMSNSGRSLLSEYLLCFTCLWQVTNGSKKYDFLRENKSESYKKRRDK